ncbi:MAG: tetratricopeptide repeat protein [Pseudomonadota bacterium]|nr:tetratricopeptide repeat protein [Pseudomonadota bacterium]
MQWPSPEARRTRAFGVFALAALASALAGCSMFRSSGTPDNEATLKVLAKRSTQVDKDITVGAVDEKKAIDAYRKFLDISPSAPQRSEAMRRIGDLEMDSADNKSASGSTAAPDYKAAIARYQDFLKTYPRDPNNDNVLYQLARAQEQSGDLEGGLKTLDRLIAAYPETRVANEVQFRRGELLFTAKNYAAAEQAYAKVLVGADSAFNDRALYMQGWSLYKQGKLEDGLRSFFAVLDLKVAGRAGRADAAGLESLEALSRADRELVEDTFRVASISLANLQGAESVPAFINTPVRKSYEFRVYQQLGELYIKQERSKDAADTFALFAKRSPHSSEAPTMQARVIEIYERTGFANQALQAKKDYVTAYSRQGEYRKVNPSGWERAQPLVKANLAELARHYHATAQQTKNPDDAQQAIQWYRESLAAFPDEPNVAASNFLLAELLFEQKRFAEATTEYEKTAYAYPAHPKQADAAYAGLLSVAQGQKGATGPDQARLQRAGIASALRFAKTFPADRRNGQILADAAEKLYALHDNEQAARVAQSVIALQPPAKDAERKIAWTVVAYAAFDAKAFDLSEKAYGEVLKLLPANDKGRAEIVERQAAAIYKQGEMARASGQQKAAAASFARVASVASGSSVGAAAQYDAAASLIAIKDWDGAIKALEDFRKRYPTHQLQAEAGKKLTVAYLEKGQWTSAAGELERIAAAAAKGDPRTARDAQWQAAELYDKGDSRAAAAKAYERYLAQYPTPLEPAVEARWRLAQMAAKDNNPTRETALMRDIFQADQAGGAGRTDRTRFLGATAALAMAEPVAASYRGVQLVEPLPRQLKLKKTKMEEALKAYAVAAEYGVADVTTAATYRIASVYRDFGKALIASERPQKLSKVELEQYNVLLEEQAFPFEEKAIELHELNAKRTASGVYDKWVKSSFDALRELKPVRYGKNEISEGVVDAIR